MMCEPNIEDRKTPRPFSVRVTPVVIVDRVEISFDGRIPVVGAAAVANDLMRLFSSITVRER